MSKIVLDEHLSHTHTHTHTRTQEMYKSNIAHIFAHSHLTERQSPLMHGNAQFTHMHSRNMLICD